MKVGDMVKMTLAVDPHYSTIGIVMSLDDRHRQTYVDILFSDNEVRERVWVNHLEVISESR